MSADTSGFSSLLRFLLGAALIMGLLIWAKTVLLPLAIAILLLIIINALTQEIAKIHIGNYFIHPFIAKSGSVILMLAGSGVALYILAIQIEEIIHKASFYTGRIDLIESHVSSIFGHEFSRQLQDFLRDIDLRERLVILLEALGTSLLTLGLVLVYLGFLLAGQKYFHHKLKLIFRQAEQAAGLETLYFSIASRVRRYLWIKTLTSLLTGLSSYAVLKSLNVDFAETWGFLAFLFNFIPNIGSPLAVFFPALIAIVQFDSLTPFFTVIVALTCIQLFIDNVVEPVFLGRSLNMSGFAIIFSLAFWGLVWGIAGMFLAVPIMVIAAIVCAHMPRWQWLAILLSEKGDLQQFLDNAKVKTADR